MYNNKRRHCSGQARVSHVSHEVNKHWSLQVYVLRQAVNKFASVEIYILEQIINKHLSV